MSARAENLAITAAATAAPQPKTAPPAAGRGTMLMLALAAFAVLAACGWVFPRWLTFLLTMAAGNGLVSLGIVGLMRGGVVPFGQGMVFAAGGYAAALALQQARLHRRARPDPRRRRRRGAHRGAVRAAPLALPRHLLRDADAGAVDGHVRPADEARHARRLRRLQRRPADAASARSCPTITSATSSTC